MNGTGLKEPYTDEIDLYELFLVIKKRINYIVIITVCGLIIGGMVSFLSPDIYRARATIWVDSLLNQSIIDSVQREGNKLTFIVPLEGKRNYEINNISISILQSLEFKKNIVTRVKESYQDKNNILQLYNSLNSDKKDAIFKAEIEQKTGSILLTSEQKDKKLAEYILTISVEQLKNELGKVMLNYIQLIYPNQQPDSSKYIVFIIIEKPNALEYPVKPKRAIIIVVSCISSLFLGIFIAFLVEWWSNLKKQFDIII